MLARFILLVLLALGSLSSVPAYAGLEDDRATFRELHAAMQDGQRQASLARLDELKDYPLADYLRYLDLRERVSSASSEEIRAFLDKVADGFMAEDIRKRVLRHLAARGDWVSYQSFDHASLDGLEFRCQRLVARGTEQGVRAVLDDALGVWREARVLPASCERMEDWLAASGKLTADLLWKRLEAAMDDDKVGEARRLAGRLQAQDRIPEWQQARKAPEKFLKKHKDAKGDTVLHHMLADAIKRVARKDAHEARALWMGLKAREHMSAWARHDAERDLAVEAARQHLPEASAWFEGVPASAMDDYAHAWKARAALRGQRWDRVLAAIEAMPVEQQAEEEWRYWRARAMEAQGQGEQARQIWQEVARGISYYGLLAADRAGVRYGLAYVDPPLDEAVEDVALRPAVRRAREFYIQGLTGEARKEWQAALRDMDPPTQRAAAHLAARWGWMDRAAITMGKARHAGLEDLEVRFPLPWRDDVERFARAEAIDSGWMFGVMRRESAFMPDISSSAGAQGLMQLMPATAKYVAKKFDLPAPDRGDLHDPATNMRLGSAYLRYVLDKFNDNQVLATAAYNAGPGRVKQWLPKGQPLPADIWVDTVPFTETREYCRAVLHYATVFEWRLHGEARPLSARMPGVSGG